MEGSLDDTLCATDSLAKFDDLHNGLTDHVLFLWFLRVKMECGLCQPLIEKKKRIGERVNRVEESEERIFST